MNRGLKILLGIVTGLVSLLVLAFVLLAAFDWNRVKPWLNERVSEATERSFAINGDLSLSWEKPPYRQTGWRALVPWPHLRAKDVVLGNADWAKTGPTMAHIQQVDFNVDLLALLKKQISVYSLLLTEPNLTLEHDKGDRNNWTFPKKESKSAWKFELQDLAINNGTVRYVDPVKRADVTSRLDTEKDGTVLWKAKGSFNGEKLTGSGKAGALLTLQASDTHYPVEAVLKVGETTITADGTLTDPAHLSALDIKLKILGASMADLFPLSGVLLPDTPKFSTEGRVVGNVKPGNFNLRYEKFKGKVGSSDIGGTLEYVQQKPRALLRGDVHSNYLNLKDLGALVGADDSEKKQKDATAKKQPPDKVLPVSPFKTDRWRKMDVQVQFTGKKIVRAESVPLDDLHVKIRVDDGVLALAPLNFGVAGGKLTTELHIDGRQDPAKARMKMTARGLKLKQLFPKVEEMHASIGEVNGDAQLTGTGNSIAELMASADGEVNSVVTEGTVSKLILEEIGLNISSIVVAKLFGDSQVQLNCMVADLGIKNGHMQTRTFVVDTKDATIPVAGEVDFNKETLGLKIRPESKGVRIISLRSPLHVEGTFKKPDVGIDKGIVALKAGAAVALGTIASPLAALLAVINPGPEKKSPCGELLARAEQKSSPAPEHASRPRP